MLSYGLLIASFRLDAAPRGLFLDLVQIIPGLEEVLLGMKPGGMFPFRLSFLLVRVSCLLSILASQRL